MNRTQFYRRADRRPRRLLTKGGLTLATALAAFTACTHCSVSGLNQDEGGEDSNLLLLLGTALAFSSRSVAINFVPTAAGAAVSCSTGGAPNTYTVAGAAGTTLKDLRMYISNVRMVAGGSEYNVTLTDDGLWQSNNIALLDFEDATGNCTGTSATNTTLLGTVAAGTYSSVRFTLGVPQAYNHTDDAASTTAPPLNVAAMDWSWTAGRKFVRFELANGADNAALHIGSTNCTGTAPDISCAKSNRAEIEVAADVNGTLQFDLAELFAPASWTITGNPACHSGAAPCDDLWPKLGLSWTDGAANSATQTVFRAQ